jgi:hypothetical protein
MTTDIMWGNGPNSKCQSTTAAWKASPYLFDIVKSDLESNQTINVANVRKRKRMKIKIEVMIVVMWL